MEVGELVAVGDVVDTTTKCPFPHDDENMAAADNELHGVGTTLGSRMGSGRSTIKREELAPTVPAKEPMPSFGSDEPVEVDGDRYPLTLAAHHLIPAQESLKDHKILDFIDEGRGVIKKNLGYDVNGCENGVWLPGPYAIEDWGDMTLEDEDLPQTAKRAKTYAKRLAELPPKMPGSQFQGRYAFASMELAKGQFHDRHVGYSKFVARCLNKIYFHCRMQQKYLCPDCKKKAEPVPPPFALLARLNGLSRRLRGYLTGSPSGWRTPLFTSEQWPPLLSIAYRRPGNR